MFRVVDSCTGEVYAIFSDTGEISHPAVNPGLEALLDQIREIRTQLFVQYRPDDADENMDFLEVGTKCLFD